MGCLKLVFVGNWLVINYFNKVSHPHSSSDLLKWIIKLCLFAKSCEWKEKYSVISHLRELAFLLHINKIIYMKVSILNPTKALVYQISLTIGFYRELTIYWNVTTAK